MPHSLHLRSLKLRNFKGVAALELPLDESLTLLAGVNGVGKTSVIQALVAAVTQTWHQKQPHEYPLYGLPNNVARTGTSVTDIVLELGWGERLSVPAGYSLEGENLIIDNSHDGRVYENLNNQPAPLPLVVYYEQNRVLNPDSSRRNVTVSSRTNRNTSLQTTVFLPDRVQDLVLRKGG